MAKFDWQDPILTMMGGQTTGDDIILKANEADSYPYIEMEGNSDINYQAANNRFHDFFMGGTNFLRIKNIGSAAWITGIQANQNIVIDPHGTGNVVIDGGFVFPTSVPGAPVSGSCYWNESHSRLYIYNATSAAWMSTSFS